MLPVRVRSRADLASAEAVVCERRLTRPSAQAEARDIRVNIDAITSTLLSPLTHVPGTDRANERASCTANTQLEIEFDRLARLIQAVTAEGWDVECRPARSTGIA